MRNETMLKCEKALSARKHLGLSMKEAAKRFKISLTSMTKYQRIENSKENENQSSDTEITNDQTVTFGGKLVMLYGTPIEIANVIQRLQ
jgi:transcriptional regulator with XRE-family HTH domain